MTDPAPSAGADERLAALETFAAGLDRLLAGGFDLARDNPGRTPPTWSVSDAAGNAVVTFGLIDRTFFWTWDSGVSNHYSKNPEMMERIIVSELIRTGHLERP